MEARTDHRHRQAPGATLTRQMISRSDRSARRRRSDATFDMATHDTTETTSWHDFPRLLCSVIQLMSESHLIEISALVTHGIVVVKPVAHDRIALTRCQQDGSNMASHVVSLDMILHKSNE